MNSLDKNYINKITSNLMEKGFDYSKNNLIVLSSQGEAFKVYSALNSLYPDQDFIHLPNSEVLPYDFF